MFETSGSGDEGWGTTPPPPAADRLWRHPSELGPRPAAPAPTAGTAVAAPTARDEHRPHRFSLGTVVVAGSLGALAMFGSLTAAGLVGGVAPAPRSDDAGSALADTAVAESVVPSTSTAPPGVVSVRLTDESGTSVGAGLVFNTAGDIVTTLPTSTTRVTVAVEVGDATWADATVLGSDPVTGLTVVRPPAAAVASARRSGVARSSITAPELGQTIDLVRPGPEAVATRLRTGTATRITSISSTLRTATVAYSGLLTLTSERPGGPIEVGVDRATGAVNALVLPVDDDPDDEMTYAVPARLAMEVGRDIEATGRARHGAFDATLVETTTTGPVVTAAATTSGLLAGDELLAIGGRPVHTADDVLGELLGVDAGTTVSVTIRRDRHQSTVGVAVVARDRGLVSTTTTP